MSDATTQVSEKAMASPSDSSPEPSMAQKPEAQEEEASTQDQAAFQPDTSDYPTGLNLYLITASLILVLFASNLDTTIIVNAIPRITDEFGSVDEVGWYGSAFFLTVSSFQSFWGKAYKYYSLKWMYLMAIAIFELGSIVCAVAQNGETLIFGRALQGAGGAGMASGSFVMVAFTAPPKYQPAFFGTMGGTYAISAFVGPLLGGVFTESLTWRWCFWINLPIGGAAAIVLLFFFKPPKASKPVPATRKEKILQFDILGMILIIGTMTCYLLAMQWGGAQKPWTHRDVIGTLVGFVLLLIAFCVNEWYAGDRALLMPRLLFKRRIWTTSVFTFFASGSYFALIYYLPIWFQAVKSTTPTESGIRNLPIIAGAGLLSVLAGFVVGIWGQWVPLMLFGIIVATIGCGLIYTFDINTGSPMWIGAQAMAGIGFGTVFQLPITANQAIVEPQDISSVSAITFFFQIMGAAIWISAAQAVFANRLLAAVTAERLGQNPHSLLRIGADGLQRNFDSATLRYVIGAYNKGLRAAFALSIAVAGVAVLFALLPKWEKVRPSAPSNAAKEGKESSAEEA